MKNHLENRCDWLDDYLVGELTADRHFEFAEHLEECLECRSEVDHWSAMSHQLQTATRELEAPRATLPMRIERERARRTQRSRRRAFGWCVTTVVGACLLFATRFIEFEAPKPSDEPIADEVVVPHLAEVSAPPALVELPDSVIGVPIDIGDPDVTVVWIYPTAQIDAKSN